MSAWFVRVWTAARQLSSTAVLAVVWFGVLTPVALFARALRNDPLQRAWEPDRMSYWEEREAEPTSSGLFAFLAQRGKLWLLPILLVLLAVGFLVVVSESSAVLVFLYPLF